MGPRSPKIPIRHLSGNPSDPLNGYTLHAAVQISNNLGYASETPAFGLPGGGQSDWRTGAYFTDAWKVTPHFTLTYGLRYQRDTGRTNSDLAPVPCSNIVTSNFDFGAAGPPCTGNAQLFDQWGAGLGDRVNQPNKNFGPQVGFAYNPPFSTKTVLRGGIGFYYDSNVFNNVQFDRASRLQTGVFAQYPAVCGANGFSLGGLTQTSTGISIKTLCSESVAAGAPGFPGNCREDYRALNSGAGLNGASGADNLAIEFGTIAFAPKYKSPYAINFNFGIQQGIDAWGRFCPLTMFMWIPCV